MKAAAVPAAVGPSQYHAPAAVKGWPVQSLHTAGGMVAFQALTLVTAVLIARGLGPESQGRFQLLMSITVVLVMGTKLGLDEGISYLLPRYSAATPAQVLPLIAYVIAVTVGLGTLAGAGIYAFAGVLEQHVFSLQGFASDLRHCLWLVPALTLMMMGMALLRGLNRADLRSYIYYYGVSAAYLVGVFGLAADGRLSPSEVYLARIATYAGGGVVCLALALRLTRLEAPRLLSGSEWRLLHSFSGLVLISLVFQYAVEQPVIDLLIVAWVASAHDVGVYSVAAKVALLTALAASAITVAIAASAVSLGIAGPEADLVRTHRSSSRATALYAVVVGLALLTSAEPLLGLFGPEYKAGAFVLSILVCGQIVAGTLGMNSPFLLGAGRAGLDCLATGGAVLVMLAGGFALGRLYGPAGVAAATAAAAIALAAARRLLCSRVLGLAIDSEELRRVALAVLSAAAVLAARQISAALGGVVGIVAIVWWIASQTGSRVESSRIPASC